MSAQAPLRFLIVCHYYWPESFRITDLAESLAARGHRVDVLTGLPNYPDGNWYPGYSFSGPTRETRAGVRVRRVRVVRRGSASTTRLAANYASFVLSAGAAAPFAAPSDVDVVFVFAPSPLTVALPALWLRALRGVPVVLWVQDLWPEALAAVGAVKRPWLLRLVARHVSWIYRHCDLILGQSEAIVDAVRARGGGDRVRYFPGSAEAVYLETPPTRTRLDEAGIPPGFRVLFAGNVGAAQGLEVLLDAAARLRDRSDIQWVVIGDGSRRQWFEDEVARRGLAACVHRLGRCRVTEMPAFFSSADALLVTLNPAPGLEATVPSKVQSYLASGRPIVAALDGEGARVLREAGAGVTCAAGDAAALAAGVVHLADLPAGERAAMGLAGRRYYDEHFDETRLLDQLEAWCRELSDAGNRASG